jgi:hypothetical protein
MRAWTGVALAEIARHACPSLPHAMWPWGAFEQISRRLAGETAVRTDCSSIPDQHERQAIAGMAAARPADHVRQARLRDRRQAAPHCLSAI